MIMKGEIMPRVDSAFFKNNLVKKTLTIELDEGEGILTAIKEAMKQHKLKEAKVEDIEGTIKSGQISFMDRSNFKSLKLDNAKLLTASGNFKLSFDDLYGTMNVSTADKYNPKKGTLVNGYAVAGLKIKLSFFQET